MNLFGDMAEKLAGGTAGQAGGQGLVGAVLQMLISQPGGLAGLAESFQQKGLGDLVASWIGTGENLPASADQIRQALGNDQLQAFAEKAGILPEAAGSQLAELLPGIVDRLTPGGQMPQGSDLMSAGVGLLQNFLQGNEPGS